MAAWGMIALGEPRGRVEGVAYAHMREHTRESPHCLVSLSPDLFWLLIIFEASRVVRFVLIVVCLVVRIRYVDACPMSVSERSHNRAPRARLECRARARAAASPDSQTRLTSHVRFIVIGSHTHESYVNND